MHITLPTSLRHPHLRRPRPAGDPPSGGLLAAIRAQLAKGPPWDRAKVVEPVHHDDPRHVPQTMKWVPIVVPLVALTMLLLGAAILSQAG